MIRLGILGSTRGTNLDAIANAIRNNQLSASIELVLSNKVSATILDKASSHGIRACFVSPEGLTREAYDYELSLLLARHRVELVVLIGYMRILSAPFISDWAGRIINIHPSLLPAHAGLMDLEVHRAVLNAQEQETGCTVHYVTEQVDAGPVLMQKTCPVQSEDTPEILKARVQEMEGQLLVAAIAKIASGNMKQSEPCA